MAIKLIDPIDSVTNLPEGLNGTPEYEKMFIFVELSAQRRGRSVIVNSDINGTNIDPSSSNGLTVNLMGADFDGSTARLTTKWTDNTSKSEKILEGFGISQIDIKVTSSFVPEVTIEFVDIKGMAFFNKGKNSPYSILFDFPPAIYDLTVKGYYGKALTYQLHLVNHSTRFESSTGNYYTTANFIARTFAPLTDIPFKMVEMLPLVDQKTEDSIDPNSQVPGLGINSEEMNGDFRVPPRNTHELIKKLESLYDNINEIKDNSRESQSITDSQKRLKLASDLHYFLNNFKSELNVPDLRNNAEKIIQDLNPDYGNDKELGRIITTINQYNAVVTGTGVDGVSSNNEEELRTRLYLGIKLANKSGGDVELDQDAQSRNRTLIVDTLTTLKTTILQNAGFLGVTDGDIEGPKENIKMFEVNSTSTSDYTSYVCLDITKLYRKLYYYINDSTKSLKESNDALNQKITDTANSTLGMKLTPYHLFKIICDDIDKFFNKLRKTNRDAESHHNEFAGDIAGNPSVKDGKTKKLTKLYSFPLYVKENHTCGVRREARAYPSDLSDSLPRPFPEVELVENFINTFINIKKEEKVEDLKTQEDADGNNKWIPVTPLDSALSGIPDYSSPYANVELRGKEDQITNSILNIILNRFYIASQFTYGNTFYQAGKYVFWNTNKELKKTDLIKFVAGAEAVNLANSLVNNETIGFFERKAKQYGNNVDTFYNELRQMGIKNYSSISPSNTLSLNLDSNSKTVYRTRSDSNYEGVLLLNNSDLRPREINDTNSSTNPVDVYVRQNDGWWKNLINSILEPNETKISRFTVENIPYINDLDYDQSKPASKYLKYSISTQQTTVLGSQTSSYKTNNLLTTWCDILSRADNNILSFLSGSTSDATKAFWLASNFGSAISYFNDDVNKLFKNPALVEVPNFSTLYMGGLNYYNNNISNVKTEIDGLYSSGFAASRPFNKQWIVSDSEAVLKLAVKDQQTFSEKFNSFITSPNLDGFQNLRQQTVAMINLVKDLINANQLGNDRVSKHDKYMELLKDNYGVILNELNKRVGVLNFSEYTFSNTVETTTTFVPLATTNQNTSVGGMKEANDIFFKEFFNKLSATLPEKKQETLKEDVNFSKSMNDEDVKTQLYYTFKSISDKWISGLGSDINKGFPLNRGSNDPLINKFIFVDRAMNPIGDQVVLNVQSLIELAKDYDVNVFSVFSRILSENGFEIFPLQNFMVHSDGGWEDIFKIFETVNQPSTPLFVCMYIGGTSSVLNGVSSEYEDDGILDFDSEALPDFKDENDCNSPEVTDKQTAQTGTDSQKFSYSQVRAFRVRYGEQNQSFFTDIQLDSKEYPETAESLAILSNIAGDESNASPVPKGQNLFNLYENRAYSTTVSMLGNVMIQPTQYFQLENIPMYSGAYVILDVNHKITPNHMVTQFQGTRILKYPNPFVTDFATSVGINGTSIDGDGDGIADDTRTKSNSYAGVVTNTNGDVLLPQLQHNSMYNLKIS